MDKYNLCLSLSDIESGLSFPKVRKLGILGGSFNPVHYGHLLLGRTALKALEESTIKPLGKPEIKSSEDSKIKDLEETKINFLEDLEIKPFAEKVKGNCILYLPTGVPYHKNYADLLPFSERTAMLSLALQEENSKSIQEDKDCLHFFYSSIEGERLGNSYSYDSVRILRSAFPNADLSLIIGTDEFFTLERWYKIEELAKMIQFLVANRNGEAKDTELEERKSYLLKVFGVKSIFLNMEKIDYSSSQIRAKINCSEPVTGMLPESVEKYIQENSLYRF